MHQTNGHEIVSATKISSSLMARRYEPGRSQVGPIRAVMLTKLRTNLRTFASPPPNLGISAVGFLGGVTTGPDEVLLRIITAPETPPS